jgi:hypothetical protein
MGRGTGPSSLSVGWECTDTTPLFTSLSLAVDDRAGSPLLNPFGVRLRRQGLAGHGECSPLPGFSGETLGEARSAVTAVSKALAGRVLSLEALERGGLAAWVRARAGDLPPSVQVGVSGSLGGSGSAGLGR